MLPRLVSNPSKPVRAARKGDLSESEIARDRQLLRERAERLLQAAYALEDVKSRVSLVLEAATLHRLATTVEEQLAALHAHDPQLAPEGRSFAARRPNPRSLN